jgi:hypothetical protein
MGKTTFLRAAEELGRREGWSTARADTDGALAVTPQTTRGQFADRLRALLGLPSHQALAAGAGDYKRGPDGADRPPLSRTRGNRWQQGPLDPLVEQLRDHRGRVLILIDGYRPSEKFASWFESTFLADVERIGSQVVTVLADVPHALERIGLSAAETFDLGPLDREAVARHFHALGATTDPPLSLDEVKIFADYADRPPLVAALERLLSLTVPGEESAVA